MISPRVFKLSLAGLAGMLVAIVSACGGGGPSVPACRTEAATPQATASPATSLTMKIDSYEGTGSPQCISGLGFQPAVVIIKGNTGQFTVWHSSSMPEDSTADFASGQPNFEDGITSLDPDAFSLGEDPSVNAEAVAYHYVAFADSPDIKVGSYVGNGSDPRHISDVGFEPVLVFLKSDSTGVGVWRSEAHAKGVASFFSAGEDPRNIREFEPDGFELGGDFFVNGAGATYHYVAFREAPGRLKMGTYEGDGSDDRDITDVGFQPDYVWIKSSEENPPVHRTSSLSGDETLRFMIIPNGTDEIQALQADGFQVGTEPTVNEDGDTYHYVAWKAGNGP